MTNEENPTQDEYETDALAEDSDVVPTDAVPTDAVPADGFSDGELQDAGISDDLAILIESGVQPAEFSDSLDIDAALAALETLPEVMAEREAVEAAERARIAALKADEEERREAERIAAEERARWAETYHLPSPPALKMQRGKIHTVVPALALMLSGAYLTFALTFSDTPPPPAFVMLIISIVIGVSLLSFWLGSERWSRGALFSGLTVLAVGGFVYMVTETDVASQANITPGWEWVIVAVSAALFLSAILARPVNGRLTVVSLACLVAGGFMLAIANGIFDASLLNTITTIAPYVLIAYLVLMVIPLLLRGRLTRSVDANRD